MITKHTPREPLHETGSRKNGIHGQDRRSAGTDNGGAPF